MAVREGYKTTELGVIPEDWNTLPLCALSTMKSGEGITSSRINEHSTYPCYGGNGLRGYTSEYTHDGKYVLIGRQGALCGNVVAVQGKFFASEHAVVVTPNATTDISWLKYLLERMKLNRYAESSAQPGLSVSKILELVAPAPPTKAEQEAIAEALSDADGLIESLEQLIAKKRQIKQGAMQELLTGKKRLPRFEGEPGLRQTEVGEIPKDWAVVSVGQLLSDSPRYGINAPAISYDSRYPVYLRITDITDEGYFNEKNKASVDHSAAPDYLLKDGDIVFARTGASVGKSYLYNSNDGELVYAGFLIKLTPNQDKLNPFYLKSFVQTQKYWGWVTENSMRSGQPGINGREFASMPIPIPPTLEEQSAIATILSDMDAEITELEAKLTKARKVKQGMMQELLTGRIRLV